MAKNLKDAVADVKSFARQFQSIIDLSAAVDDIGSLERAASSALARKIQADKDNNDALDTLKKTRSVLNEAENDVATAKSEAMLIRRKANDDATKIRGDAGTRANEIINQANSSAQQVEGDIAAKKKAIKSLDNDIKARRSTLEGLDSDLADLQAKARAIAS